MKATRCAHHDGCRYQQDIIRVQKRYGVYPDDCWAEEVKCDDQKNDMDKRCDQFKPTKAAVRKCRDSQVTIRNA